MSARRGSLTNAQVGQAIWDYKHGRSAAEIGADLGVSARMIHYHLKVRKVPLHRPRKKPRSATTKPRQPATRSRLGSEPYEPPLIAPLGPGVSWVESALCRQVDPEIFFPTQSGDAYAHTAKRVCRHCPVVAECLEYALTHEEHGIWGGTTQRQRNKIRNQQLTRKEPA